MNFKFGGLCCLVPLFDFVTFSLTKIPPCVFTIFLKLSLDAAIKKEFRLDQFSRSFPAIRLFWRKKQIFDFVTFSFLFWLNSSNFGLGWQKRRTLKAKKISSNCGGVTSSNLSSPFTAVHLQIFSWTFVCQGPFITALQLLNWLAIHQDCYIQVNIILIWLVQKLSADISAFLNLFPAAASKSTIRSF